MPESQSSKASRFHRARVGGIVMATSGCNIHRIEVDTLMVTLEGCGTVRRLVQGSRGAIEAQALRIRQRLNAAAEFFAGDRVCGVDFLGAARRADQLGFGVGAPAESQEE